MNENKISNSIYISFATLEVMLGIYFSGIYDNGGWILFWLMPILLIMIPCYRIIKKNWKPNN